MNLSADYLGLKLRTPLVPSASPLSERLDYLKRMEDAGAAAVVLHSLFEEPIRQDQNGFPADLMHGDEWCAGGRAMVVSPETYLAEVAEAKSALAIPVIASLNGSTPGGGPITPGKSSKPGPMHWS